jgi:uncharacterized protein YjbI with pentapeptide repeats
MAESWPTCDQDGCQGVCVADATGCLAHVGAKERDATLAQFAKSGELDARGVTISEALRQEIVNAAPSAGNSKLFPAVNFDKAIFESTAWFDTATFKKDSSFRETTFKDGAGFSWGTTFEGRAIFSGAKFKGYARFEKAKFKGSAEFDKVTFDGRAGFNEATFEGVSSFHKATFEEAAFNRVTFKSDADFSEAKFGSSAWFDHITVEDGIGFIKATFKDDAVFTGTTIGSVAWFREATFEGVAVFSEVTVEGETKFSEATFKRDAKFNGATFKSGAVFDGARFEGDVPALGPFLVEGTLNLDEVQFTSRVRIQADITDKMQADATDKAELTCCRGRFLGGVRFDVRRALISLDDSDLSVPSLLVGAAASPTERPRLLSLQRANVAGLTLGNVDLSDCRFAGVHNLDKLRLEADTVFGLSPARVGWERREVIAEESAWRATRRPTRWAAPAWRGSDDPPEPLSPGVIAGLYRALRKGREDSKDEPGAAEFYYGEMEMRRHDHGAAHDSTGSARGWATRCLLFVYWLVSGYGLRAWRSLTALAVVTAFFALAFDHVGFTQPPEPPSYWTSLVFAFRSTISLTDNQVTLTAWGSFLQALLRLSGPVLLALTLLALRGRVKR